MTFPVQGTWLDFCVLVLVNQQDTYGYELNQILMDSMDLSESTLYPVLRRLSKEGALDTYDRAYDGRNRRYYRITPTGEQLLAEYREEWKDFKQKIDDLLGGENHD